MNHKQTPKTPPAYPLTPEAYQAVLSYWSAQIANGRVLLGKVEAMNELIEAGAQVKENKKTRSQRVSVNARSAE